MCVGSVRVFISAPAAFVSNVALLWHQQVGCMDKFCSKECKVTPLSIIAQLQQVPMEPRLPKAASVFHVLGCWRSRCCTKLDFKIFRTSSENLWPMFDVLCCVCSVLKKKNCVYYLSRINHSSSISIFTYACIMCVQPLKSKWASIFHWGYIRKGKFHTQRKPKVLVYNRIEYKYFIDPRGGNATGITVAVKMH